MIRTHTQIDVLILNAGVFGLPFTVTEDGCEETFQVNYLAQVYLASLLRGVMSKALRPRMVVVSAESHRFSTLADANIIKVRAIAFSSYLKEFNCI